MCRIKNITSYIGVLYFIISIFLIQSINASYEEDRSSILSCNKSVLLTNKEDELKLLKGLEKKHEDSEFQILFLCTGNSCRSQMAEGWTRHLGGEAIVVQSAGIETHGLNLNAVKVMKDSGVDISEQFSKTVNPSMLEWADVVVTVCGDADERCPLLPKSTPKLHWPIVDPAKAIGDEGEVLMIFQSVSSLINSQVLQLIEVLKEAHHIQ